jgi:hypothetical protein
MKDSDIYKFISCNDVESSKAFTQYFKEELIKQSVIFPNALNSLTILLVIKSLLLDNYILQVDMIMNSLIL